MYMYFIFYRGDKYEGDSQSTKQARKNDRVYNRWIVLQY